MKNSELESIYRANNGSSMVDALRLIYNMGFCDGASITPDANFTDKSIAAAKPAEASIQVVKQKIGK